MTLSPYPTRAVVTAGTESSLYSDPDVFPYLPGRKFVASKGSEWSTGVKRSASGRERRVSFFSNPIWHFSIKHEVVRNLAATPELAQLLGFFNQRQGRYGFFFYLDREDNAVTDTQFGTGDGVTTTFQMQRTQGGAIEPVQAFWNTPVVKVNGTPTAAFTLAPWGKITFTSAPAAGAVLTWTGSFLFVCGFEDDRLDMSQLVTSLWSQDGFNFKSLKP